MSEFYKDGYVEELEQENLALIERVKDLEHVNSTMMRTIQLADAKQALMEASPEFAKALENIEQN